MSHYKKSLQQMGRFWAARSLFAVLAYLVLGLANAWVYPAAAVELSTASFLQQNTTDLLNNTSVISDFDGDNQPDLVTSRSEGHSYKIEIQLSARQEKFSFTVASSERAIGLFACDVDQDNDKDLLIVSATSLQPLGVWLNDGQGHFEKDNYNSCANTVKSDNPSLHEDSTNQVYPLSINQNDRFSFTRAILGFVSPILEAKDPILSRLRGPVSQFLAYKLATRGPPLNHTL